MKVVIQRVKSSAVHVDGEIIATINKGLNLLVCMEKEDLRETVIKAAKKIISLRIFSDDDGRMNKSLKDIEGELLAVSQFTLSWDGKKGNRPSFDNSMPPNEAKELFDFFVAYLKQNYCADKVQTGQFGASMEVTIKNDGPVTFSFNF